jgi:multicomponent Na+:H+ antiporter subunit B
MIGTIVSIILLTSIFFLFVLNVDFGSSTSSFTPELITRENGSQNMVSSIVLDFRLFDTFFEVLVFTIAIIGVSFYMEKLPEYKGEDTIVSSPVIQIMTPILFQIIVMISLYIALTGHLGPGGGFAAGVMMGTGLIGVSFVKPMDEIEDIFKKSKIEKFKILSPLFIIIYGIMGVLWGDAFFANFPFTGKTGELLSGGSAILLNFVIGFEVFAGTWTILYKFIKHRGLL